MWILKNYSSLKDFKKTNGAFAYGPITYNTDGIATCLNCDFIQDPQFKKAYQAAVDTNPWPGFTLQWRVYIVCFFANQVKSLNGDFVECGVNTGAYAKAIINYINFNDLNKTFYLLDTYDGLVPELLTNKEREMGLDDYLAQYKNVYDRVIKNFAMDNVRIIKGIVPHTLSVCTAEKNLLSVYRYELR